MLNPKRILIETSDWLAVHKFPGELVIADRWGKEKRDNILLYEVGDYLRSQGHQLDASGRDLYPVHRLDRDTSGIVLFAKNQDAHRDLSQKFEGRQMQKTYWAFCQGAPQWDEATCRVPLIRAEGKEGRGRAHVDLRKGKESETDLKVLGRYGDICWLEARPKTGRLHQIRVHARVLGHPLINDPLYGITNWRSETLESSPIKRMPLHARELEFEDKGQAVKIVCPLDDELRSLVTYLQQEFK